MGQILAMVVNERQNDWGVHLAYVELVDINTVSAATGLAPNDAHMNHLPCLPLTIFEHHYARGHPNPAPDHLEYCNLVDDRQQRPYGLVRL